MSKVFNRMLTRVTASRARNKIITKKPDIEKAVVRSGGVVAINGQQYSADVAGYRSGDVIDVENVKTKGNAHYRARFGSRVETKVTERVVTTSQTATTTGGTSTPITMTVTPADNINDYGTSGDDFTYNTQTYTLTNTSAISIDWSIEHAQYWVDISTTSGTLAAGASTTVDVSVNSSASGLLGGGYTDVIVFYAESYAVATRFVTLEITAVDALALSVTPTATTNIQMFSGGSGAITFQYEIGNIGSSNLNWTAVPINNHVSLSSSSGSLAVDDYAYVTATIDSDLYSATIGSYSDILNWYIEAA